MFISLSVSKGHETSFVISHHFQYRKPFRFQQLFISTRRANCTRLKIPLFILQHVDSASEDEVSESEETVDGLLATGNDHDTSEDSDNEALATPQKNKASTYTPITNIPGTEEALFSVTQTYPLPSLPSTSLEDSTLPEYGGSPSSHQSGSLVTGRSDVQRIPVQSKLEESKNLCLNLLWFVPCL